MSEIRVNRIISQYCCIWSYQSSRNISNSNVTMLLYHHHYYQRWKQTLKENQLFLDLVKWMVSVHMAPILAWLNGVNIWLWSPIFAGFFQPKVIWKWLTTKEQILFVAINAALIDQLVNVDQIWMQFRVTQIYKFFTWL